MFGAMKQFYIEARDSRMKWEWSERLGKRNAERRRQFFAKQKRKA